VTYPATTVGSLPTAPEKTSFAFGGWYTQPGGAGTQFTAGTTVTGNITVYAKWTFSPIYTEKNNLAVGDIVLQNGKYVSYSNFISAPAEYLAVSQPAGIVAYFGETGTAGITGKIYMVGLLQSDSLKWAKEDTTGCSTVFSTSNTAGEGNWAVIQAADPTGSADAATNYPAFNYANTYSVTGYTTGWFLPSAKYVLGDSELRSLYNNRTTINNTMTALSSAGVTVKKIPSNGSFWSSSAPADDGERAYSFVFDNGGTYPSDKYDSYRVRVVRALD
jgi:uncharacterized repeat protein (TIGR02543 family)